MPIGTPRREARGPDAIDRAAHLRMIDSTGHAEARRQIVGSDQHAIHAFHSDDRFDVGDRIAVLGLDDDRGVVVRGLHVLANLESVAVGAGDAEPSLTGWARTSRTARCAGRDRPN